MFKNYRNYIMSQCLKTINILCKQIKICHYYDIMTKQMWQGGLPFFILFAELMPLPAKIQILTSGRSIKLPSDILIRSDRFGAALLLISLRWDHYVN